MTRLHVVTSESHRDHTLNHPPTAIVDGDPMTYYASKGRLYEWFQIDLGGIVKVETESLPPR